MLASDAFDSSGPSITVRPTVMDGVTRAYFEYVKAPSDGTKFFSNLVSTNPFLTALA